MGAFWASGEYSAAGSESWRRFINLFARMHAKATAPDTSDPAHYTDQDHAGGHRMDPRELARKPGREYVTWHRFKRSRTQRLGIGLWFCAKDDNGPALRGAPHRINGVYLNTTRGLFGVVWLRSERSA